MKINWKARDWHERCPTHFEKKIPGRRIVSRRWQCPRPKMKGLPYCAYCEPYSEKVKRRDAADESKEKLNGS